jgi:hypothetical protein
MYPPSTDCSAAATIQPVVKANTAIDREWSSKDLIAIVPVVATSFAFAYVVGYFLAFDISWFPFFSLSEHTVFAIRALPVAIGVSIVFLILITHSQIQDSWKYRGTVCWILVLVAAAILAILYAHLALAASFSLVAVGAYIHYRSPAPRMSFTNILYWAITLTVVCLIVGCLSATSWKWAWELDRYFGHRVFPLRHPMIVQIGKDARLGQIVFVGDQSVLFYEYETKTTHLWPRAAIQELCESTEDKEQQSAGDKQQLWERYCSAPQTH